MEQRRFFTSLGFTTAGAALGIFLITLLPGFKPNSKFSWISLAFFIGITIIMYYAGLRATKSRDKHKFTRMVMGFTFGKLFFSIALVLAYKELAQPESKLFLLPFFGVYLIYTIFETSFLTKLGKMKAL